MEALRHELQAYIRACEHVLALNVHSELTEEERVLIIYYINELSQALLGSRVVLNDRNRLRTSSAV